MVVLSLRLFRCYVDYVVVCIVGICVVCGGAMRIRCCITTTAGGVVVAVIVIVRAAALRSIGVAVVVVVVDVVLSCVVAVELGIVDIIRCVVGAAVLSACVIVGSTINLGMRFVVVYAIVCDVADKCVCSGIGYVVVGGIVVLLRCCVRRHCTRV